MIDLLPEGKQATKGGLLTDLVPAEVSEVPVGRKPPIIQDPNEAYEQAKNTVELSVDLELPVAEVEKNYEEIRSWQNDELFNPNAPPPGKIAQRYDYEPDVHFDKESLKFNQELRKKKVTVVQEYFGINPATGQFKELKEKEKKLDLYPTVADPDEPPEEVTTPTIQDVVVSLPTEDIKFILDTTYGEDALPDELEGMLVHEYRVREYMENLKKHSEAKQVAIISGLTFTNLFEWGEWTSRKGIHPVELITGERKAQSLALEASARVLAEKNELNPINAARIANIGANVLRIALEFWMTPGAPEKLLLKIPAGVRPLVSTGIKFATHEALTAPRVGETITQKGLSVTESFMLGFGVGTAHKYLPKARYRVPTIVGGFSGMTYMRTGDIEASIETGITVLGFEALHLMQRAKQFSTQKLRNQFATKAVRAARLHNPELNKFTNKEVTEILEKQIHNFADHTHKDLSKKTALDEIERARQAFRKGNWQPWRDIMTKYTDQHLKRDAGKPLTEPEKPPTPAKVAEKPPVPAAAALKPVKPPAVAPKAPPAKPEPTVAEIETPLKMKPVVEAFETRDYKSVGEFKNKGEFLEYIKPQLKERPHPWVPGSKTVRPYVVGYGCDGSTDMNIHYIAQKMSRALGINYADAYITAYPERVDSEQARNWIEILKGDLKNEIDEAYKNKKVKDTTIIPKNATIQDVLDDLYDINNHSLVAILEEEIETRGISFDTKLKDLKPTPPVTEPAVKEAWEMTADEYVEKRVRLGHTGEGARLGHKADVKQAASEGKPVPRTVLEEYKGEKWADEALAKAEPVVKEVEAPPEQVKEVAEKLPTAEISRKPVTVEGKTYHPVSLPTEQIGVDAKRFQFKLGAKLVGGVTEAMKEVERFDPIKGGQILVWQDKAGKYWVVDGHHRVALAQKTGQESLETWVVREKDGWSAADARAEGALRNLADGKGTSVDAAKLFRDSDISLADLRKQGVPTNNIIIKQGLDMKNLSDYVFRLVVDEKLPPSYAAPIGNLVKGDAHQKQVADLILEGEIDTVRQAELLAATIDTAPVLTKSEQTLFGLETTEKSLYAERAKILANVEKRLKVNKKVFGVLATQTGIIEAKGNILAKVENLATKERAEEVLYMLEKLANAKGPVAEALNDATKEYAKNPTKETLAKVTKRLLEEWTEGPARLGIPGGAGVQPLPLERAAEKAVEKAPKAGEILFDDTYKGKRFTYGLNYRPVASANLPKGWIVESGRKHPDFKAFGTIDFPRQLTEREVTNFQLTPITEKAVKPPTEVAKPKVPIDRKQVDALRKAADSLQKQIDAKRDPAVAQQAVTRRRAGQIASAQAQADRLELQQKALRALADAHESGTIPESLRAIKSRAEVELILPGSRFNAPSIRKNWLKDIWKATEGVKGSRILKEQVRLMPSTGEMDYTQYLRSEEDINAISKLVKMAEAKGEKNPWIREELAEARKLIKHGWDTKESFEQAQTDLKSLLGEQRKIPQKERQIQEKIHALIGVKIAGFFPTPKPVIDRMIKMAGIQKGDYVLEPSAGKGDIADALKEAGAKVDVAEIVPSLQEILKLKDYQLIGKDFLEMKLSALGVQGLDVAYDKIVMNPPFEKGQDIDHVKHAYELLKPGGTVVSIMSEGPFFRSDKKATAFRQWFESVKGSSEKLVDAFKGAPSFRQTGVSGRIVVIQKSILPMKGGFVDVTPLAKVHETFMSIIEPSKAVEIAQGKDVYAEVIDAISKADVAMIEFNEKELETLDSTLGEWGKALSKYPNRILEMLMLSRGKPVSPEAIELQNEALQALAKEAPELVGTRKMITKASDFNYDYLKEVVGDEIHYVDDYFYGIYKDPRKVEKFLKHWKTTKRFIKQKKLPTVADAKAFGLDLRDPNPVNNLRSEYLAIARLDGMIGLKDTLMKSGEGIYIDKTELAPIEWDKIHDPVFADVRAAPELAKMINSLISTNKIQRYPVLNTIRQINNILRTIKFIGSAFHMGVIAKQAFADSGYFGFYKETALRGITKGFKKGDLTFKTPEYLDYISHGGGHRYSIESEAQRAFSNAITRMGKAGIIAKGVALPFQLPEKFVRWMFQNYIPKVKYFKYLDTVREQEVKLGRSLTPAEKIDIIKEGQNFYGMMNERLFGRSGTVTTLLRFKFMAPGFAEGDYRTMLKAILQWGGDEGFKAHRSRSNIINSFVATAIAATIGTIILTGKPPKKPERLADIRDLFKIDTGMVDQNGRRIMIDLMTYDKDYWAVFGNIATLQPGKALETTVRRLGGMTSTTWEVLSDLNQMSMGRTIYDWKGDRVTEVTDSFIQKVLKLSIHELQKAEPISTNVFQQARKKGVGTALAAAMTLAGVRLAKSEQDKREIEILSQIFSLRDQQEALYWYLGSIKNPKERIKEYNKTVMRILDNPVTPLSVKDEYEPKLIIDVNRLMANRVYRYLGDRARLAEYQRTPEKYTKEIKELRDDVRKSEKWLRNFEIPESQYRKHLIVYELKHRKLIKEIQPEDNREDLKDQLAEFYADKTLASRELQSGINVDRNKRLVRKYNVIGDNVSEIARRLYDTEEPERRERYLSRIQSAIERVK